MSQQQKLTAICNFTKFVKQANIYVHEKEFVIKNSRLCLSRWLCWARWGWSSYSGVSADATTGTFPWERAVVYKTDVRGIFCLFFLPHVAGRKREERQYQEEEQETKKVNEVDWRRYTVPHGQLLANSGR